MYNLYILYVQLVHLICTVLVANSVCFETFFVENANDNPNGIKCYKEDRKLNKTLQCFVYLFAHVSLLFQILQPSEKNLVHGLDVAALPGDVFPHGIEVAEEFTEKIWDDLYAYREYSGFVKNYWKENDIDPDIRPGDMELIQQAKIDFIAVNCYRSDVGMAPDNSYVQEIGLNKYGRKGEFIYTNLPGEYALDRNPYVETTDWDWHIDGVSMRYALRYLWDHYHLPMVITEAGFGAHEDLGEDGQIHDQYRIDYLRDYIYNILSAYYEANYSDTPINKDIAPLGEDYGPEFIKNTFSTENLEALTKIQYLHDFITGYDSKAIISLLKERNMNSFGLLLMNFFLMPNKDTDGFVEVASQIAGHAYLDYETTKVVNSSHYFLASEIGLRTVLDVVYKQMKNVGKDIDQSPKLRTA